MNELRTDFIFNDRDGAKVDALRKNLLSLNRDLNNLGGINPTFGKNLNSQFDVVNKNINQFEGNLKRVSNTKLKSPTDDLLKNALADIKRMQAETIAGEKAITRSIERESKLQADIKIREQRRAANNLINSLKTQNTSTGGGNELLGGLGVPLGIGAGIALGISIGGDSLQKIKETRNAQLQLKSATIETGLSYEYLSSQAEKFGEKTLQSNRLAQASFAQIVNFANAAGRNDKLEIFRQRLADLAAAKGIDPTNLGEIAKQLNALTDEATDKLLGANPSAFYDKFAKSIGKTAESLSDAEKRAAVFDEIIRRGALFQGTAEKKINEATSAVDKLAVKFDNAKTSIGNALVPLADFLNKTIELFTVSEKKTGLGVVGEGLQKAIDRIAAVSKLRTTDEQIRKAQLNPLANLENFALSKVNLATGFSDPAARAKAIETATAEAQKFVETLKKRFESAINSGDPLLVKFARKEFSQFSNLFDAETREKFVKGFSAIIAAGFQKAISDAKQNVPQLRRTLQEIFASTDLTPDVKKSLIEQADSQIKQLVEQGKQRVKELGKTYNELFDSLSLRTNQNNPFVLLYSEADKSLKSLRENSRGLSRDLISQFESLEQKANNLKLFDLRLNNNLTAFDLRDQAENFRNPFTPRPAEDTKREQDKLIAEYLRNNPNFLFLEGKSEVDEATRLKILNSTALGRASLATNNPFEPLQKRLEKQLEIIYSGSLSADELGIADRRFISLTNGVNANELTANLRQEAALAREREADRLERVEQEAKKQRSESLRVQEQIRDELRRLNELAEKEGIQGIIRIIDETNGRVNTRLGKTPNESDTRRLFGQFIDD